MELELSINELDVALSQCKNGTACGMDGISYKFLKTYWRYLKYPLLKYARHCFRQGRLTTSFRSAAIKLIPKKGDCTKIKNWRPISLLNCSYKVVSRAINNRLKKVTDRITSRAQKGFTESRVIQEVLINVIENMSFSKNNNIPACLLALDQEKAFDSVRHDYLVEVLEFFGFGQNMIRMVTTACTNRLACIIDENGNYSRNFVLGRGTAQGDCPSPTLFVFLQQVLLFKLELDPGIDSIFPENLGPVFAVGAQNNHFKNESNRETDKVDCFADDTTSSTTLRFDSLNKIKNILETFSVLSGLKCNFEKTNLLPINGDVTEEIRNLGFNIVDKITLLGVEIDKDLRFLDTVHDKTIRKVTSVANYWKRFRLSMPGRIAIAKTLLYSQIGYVASIIPPTQRQSKQLEGTISNFVKANLTISEERIFSPPPIKEG